ncbi:probable serine/threonine-protein kinase SIS8 isoform X2 [Nymphaea colorata]|uniref:probable serine/threonine-protein kinase SIS8 isoform X2 n=1 Tax=Nymphaea colorata TaxID=210225 RepID=UPI00129D9F7D|nr:probable serine/threonine-protein kinase SIS8 isoform X2 [Nymphaea colorata]
MSKMKHLLRKLHIGGNCEANNGRQASPSSASSSASVPADHGRSNEPPARLGGRRSSTTSPSSSVGPARSRSDGADRRDDALNFNLLEEEYQVQLALAISASDPNTTEDPEAIQIKAVKRISLGCSPSPATTLVEFLSLRYWKYNVVNYDEKVLDGFYDVFGVIHDPTLQGRIPSLVELQAKSFSDGVNCEVILVNRSTDPILKRLEQKAACIAAECHALELGPVHSGLVQKIADLVVDTMGGPVNDTDDIAKKWIDRSHQLKTSLNSIVLPLGCLGVGLSRHRSLLFKVLADKINLPCRLVKGSYYTGTDEGAVNMVKIDHQSEFIIDLMGAPGTLIPAEIPSGCHSGSKDGKLKPSLVDSNIHPPATNSDSSGAANYYLEYVSRGIGVETSQAEMFEHEFGKLLPSLDSSCKSLARREAETPGQQMKVKDVSTYVISSAQNPQFAQKLHAVLLENEASPPSDLFSDIPHIPGKEIQLGQHSSMVENFGGCASSDHEIFAASASIDSEMPDHENDQNCCLNRINERISNIVDSRIAVHASNLSERRPDNGAINGDRPTDKIDETGGCVILQNCQENIKGQDVSEREMVKSSKHDMVKSFDGKISPAFADWEIPWEDLQIGERIGLGSYGEVYHADWNGTEVAVKKFLDQDLSGDAIQQFKCEVEIMLRLRHPNVVLFMGAVTHPPNLSILTEFLPRGSLFRLLHRSNVQIDEKRRLKMAFDVAKGMNYLHTSHPTIVHRDLKSPNLLVDRNWVVKVCDFGLSRLKHHTFLSSKSTAGTPEWMAPEVLRNEPSNEKCDVYSFGVILWELATLRIPWSGMNPMQVVGAVGFQNRHLDIPEEVHPMVAKVIRDCWQSDPSQRPSFAQLLAPLKQLRQLIVGNT